VQVDLDKKCGGKVRWKSAVEGRKKSHTQFKSTSQKKSFSNNRVITIYYQSPIQKKGFFG
jgi:hypothetical protein